MGSENFKESFLSEAREHLDNLNDGVLNLEKEPENAAYINQVFRACHTLKGNSSMMGYNHFSELAHEMENLLSKVRDKEIKADSEVIGILFDGVDLLEEGLENINEKDLDNLNTAEILERIQRVKGETEKHKTDASLDVSEYFHPTQEQSKSIEAAENDSKNVFRLIVYFNSMSPLKGPKTQILMKKLAGVAQDYIFSNPDIEDINNGNIPEGFELVLSTSKSKEELENTANCISESHVTVLELNEPYKDEHKPTSFVKSTPEKKDIAKVYDKKIQSIKVDVQKLDSLVNLVGELLISNMRMKQVSKEITSPELNEVVNNIDRLTMSIQEHVLKQRMVECGQIFSRYPRLVRDISKKLNKKINLIIEGGDIELDRTVLDEIGEPLIHLLRNSIDHGIEDPETRMNKGKNETGTIRLMARRDKNHAIIEIKDDGKGIDTDKVVQTALSKGLVTEKQANEMSEKKKMKLIFRAGLSTKKEVSDLSGRGVGMDVVVSKIKNLGGDIKIDSKIGEGTTVKLQLPLTLAIITSLIVKVYEEKYALPISHVLDTANIKKGDIKTIQGNEVVILRKEDIPIVRLDSFFGKEAKEKDTYSLVITERGEQKVAFIVDEILFQQPILIKNLHPLIQGVKGIAGASILGDGRVCLILDTQNIH